MARKKKSSSKSNKPQSKTDAYTGMLGISLLALIGGGVLIFLDYQKYDYGQAKPPKVTIDPYGPRDPKKTAPVGGAPGGVPGAGAVGAKGGGPPGAAVGGGAVGGP